MNNLIIFLAWTVVITGVFGILALIEHFIHVHSNKRNSLNHKCLHSKHYR